MLISLKPHGFDGAVLVNTESDAVATGSTIASEAWMERFDTLTLDEAASNLTAEIASSFEEEDTEEAVNFAYGLLRCLLRIAGKPTGVRTLEPSELPR